MRKFGEPWVRITCDEDRIYVETEDDGSVDCGSGVGHGKMHPYLARARVCINALSGVPDPAALMVAVQECVRAHGNLCAAVAGGDEQAEYETEMVLSAALRRLEEVMRC